MYLNCQYFGVWTLQDLQTACDLDSPGAVVKATGMAGTATHVWEHWLNLQAILILGECENNAKAAMHRLRKTTS